MKTKNIFHLSVHVAPFGRTDPRHTSGWRLHMRHHGIHVSTIKALNRATSSSISCNGVYTIVVVISIHACPHPCTAWAHLHHLGYPSCPLIPPAPSCHLDDKKCVNARVRPGAGFPLAPFRRARCSCGGGVAVAASCSRLSLTY